MSLLDNAVPSSRAFFRHVLHRLVRTPGCLLVLVITLHSVTLQSQTGTGDQVQTRNLRFDLSALVGYRTSMAFPTEQNLQGFSPRLVLGAKPSYGIAAGVRLDEDDLIELRWARQNTNVHLEGGAPSLSEKVFLDQLHGDFTHEYILDDWPAWARPFVIGSIGATRIAGGPNNSFTRFSFGLGGGVKVYFTRQLGLRVQAEWLPVVVSPEVGSFLCGGGCVAHLTGTVVSQGEIAVGPVFRF